MDNKERFELNDEELENVVGGVSVGDRARVNARVIRYCPGCNRLATIVNGTVIDKMYYAKGGYYLVNVKSDCCGYVERAVESACTVQ